MEKENKNETIVNYPCSMGQEYDLVKQEHRRTLMIGKLKREEQRIGLEEFKSRLLSQALEIKAQIDPKVRRWYTLCKQIEFVEMWEEGRIKAPEYSKTEKTPDVDIV